MSNSVDYLENLEDQITQANSALRLDQLEPSGLQELQQAMAGILNEHVVADGVYGPQTQQAFEDVCDLLYAGTDKTSIGLGTLQLIRSSYESSLDSVVTSEAPQTPKPMLSLPGHNPVVLSYDIYLGCGVSWSEFTKGGTRVPETSQVVTNIVSFMKKFKPIRQSIIKQPVIVTSGYRPPAVNRSVGGASNSYHLCTRGAAMDFYVESMTARQLYNLIKPHWDGGCAVSDRGQFVHLDDGPHRTWLYN